MIITNTIFCLPPYISTTWPNVMALHMKGKELCVTLADGELVLIPKLNQQTIDKIFQSHATFLQEEEAIDKAAEQIVQAQGMGNSPFLHMMGGPGEMGGMPIRFGMMNLDNMANAMQHNPAQAHLPDLPQEILEKVATIAKVISPEDPAQLPEAEPHCNCMYCQIARVIHCEIKDGQEQLQVSVDEEVGEEELQFEQWEINQLTDKHYLVVNKLDRSEEYKVQLKEEVGCTCGSPNCEHLIAVLRS